MAKATSQKAKAISNLKEMQAADSALMAKSSDAKVGDEVKFTQATEPVKEAVEQPKEETVQIGQTSAVLTEEVKLVEIPKSEAIERGFIKEDPKEELSMEEKIVNFFNSREAGTVKMNDFLKSLYPLPKFNEPAEYLRQGRSKELKGILTKLQAEGKILLADNNHLKLGSFYYTDGDTQTKYHNILFLRYINRCCHRLVCVIHYTMCCHQCRYIHSPSTCRNWCFCFVKLSYHFELL